MEMTDKEMQLVILQVLLGARKKNPRSGGLTLNQLKEILHIIDGVTMQKVLEELAADNLIETFGKEFCIRADGTDFLLSNLPVQLDFCPPKDDPDSMSGVPS